MEAAAIVEVEVEAAAVVAGLAAATAGSRSLVAAAAAVFPSLPPPPGALSGFRQDNCLTFGALAFGERILVGIHSL